MRSSTLRLPAATEDIVTGARFVARLPPFLRRPMSYAEARSTLRRRLDHRQSDLIALIRRAIYGYGPSPYRPLLDHAGCELGDVERLARLEGVEGALRELYRRGVYLTVDEFKGRKPTVRGSTTVAVSPGELANPHCSFHVVSQTSGSRGGRIPVQIDLAFIRDRGVHHAVVTEARGGQDWVHAIWAVPGGMAIAHLLEFSAFGARPARWFSQVDPELPGLHPIHRWSAQALRVGSLLAGRPLPGPRYVPLDDPLPVAHWLGQVLRSGRTPHLITFPTTAIRMCQAAEEAGIDLRGARFLVGSEPFTTARRDILVRVGGEVVSRYASTESGTMGYGCLSPREPDDLHLLTDFVGMIQPGDEPGPSGLPPRGLLVTSLRPTTPCILLNVSMGDQAELVERSCGCPLERLGWATHLHTVRSFEKLTAGGMAFLDTDVIRVLDEVLPARFGGGPTDYQLLEEEDEHGRPRLRLLVHPALGPLDERAVADAFLREIGAWSLVERVMEIQWRQAGWLRVERRAPQTTVFGKIHHLHQERREARLPVTTH
jgi:hypothetical protein